MYVAVTSLAAFAFSQIATPGPANMAMLAAGARLGFRAALPFMFGVLLGKQLIIWPIGFGLMELAERVPYVFVALKYLSATYIIWLAWRVANMRLNINQDPVGLGFREGLFVHPLNPKAWMMITYGFSNYVATDAPVFLATAWVAGILFVIQAICHPIWTFFGDRIAKTIIGTPFERYLMWGLAGLTVTFVMYALLRGEL